VALRKTIDEYSDNPDVYNIIQPTTMDEDIIQRLISFLDLQPLPREGGLFRESYRSAERIAQKALPRRYSGQRSFGAAIYYLLKDEPDSFSAIHRLQTDEIYHFYLGDPVELLLLYPDGNGQVVILGSDIFSRQQVQLVVPCGVWQASRVQKGGRYALLGTTTAPGYEELDFEAGSRSNLQQQYPAWSEWIEQLTR
jgi:uncharacterized protein